jgi:hypothetical protein
MATIQETIRSAIGHIVGRPLCPNCGRSMHLTRITPANDWRTGPADHGCGECGVWVTEAVRGGEVD